MLEATLKVSGCELWCAVVSRVRCGSRAAAKLPWLQVVADAVRLRLARRCMTEAGAAVRLGGIVVWRRYAAAALLCGCGCGCGCSVAVRLRCVVVVREVHEIALGQTDPGRTKLHVAAVLGVDSVNLMLFTSLTLLSPFSSSYNS